MIGQWFSQVSAQELSGIGYFQSFHFDFPAESVVAQISLTRINEGEAPPPALSGPGAQARFLEYTTADGQTHVPSTPTEGGYYFGDFFASFSAKDVTSFTGDLFVCYADAAAIINVFVWP